MADRTELAHMVVRWSARVLSIASTVVLLFFLFGEPFNVWRITAKEWAGLALFPLGVVIGFAIAWWKEVLGGAITLISVVSTCLLFVGSYGRLQTQHKLTAVSGIDFTQNEKKSAKRYSENPGLRIKSELWLVRPVTSAN